MRTNISVSTNPIEKKFNNNIIELHPNKEHEFVMTTKQVANAYGVDSQVINRHKYRHSDELLENKHFFLVCTKSTSENKGAQNLPIKKAYWTKRGVITLGYFIKSERAKQFRIWATNLILDHLEKKQPKRKALGKGLELPKASNPQISLAGLSSITITDDSMSPDYFIGDTVLVDTKRKRGEGVFAVRIDNFISIYRVQKLITGEWEFSKTNTLFQPFRVKNNSMKIDIYGEVVGYLRQGVMS